MRDVFIDDWIFGAFISLIMNYLLLWATGRILNKNRAGWRLLAAAFFGSIYYFVLCFRMAIGTVGNYELIIFIGTGILMLVIAFPQRSVKELLRTIGLFALLLVLTSGVTYFLLYPPFFPAAAYYNPWQVVLVNILSLLVVTELGWGLVHQVLLEKECLFALRLSVNGNSREFSALLDTGNTLVDPLTRHPVLVVESQVLQGVVPPEILALSERMAEGGLPDNKALEFSPDWMARIRFISYTSVGRQKGFLLGFRPDEVCLLDKEPKRLPPVVIGLYQFAKLGGEGKYQALLPSTLLNGVY
ncbi:sigma-E processing peptidase SpoIIGA [Capillibacterium thermochitinicola]|uniref:Sporulation sigma-E factor-processing peptidase n=1 Tax=Capillibacterium thermochitinicola TaxID=2699427 RepID=A0A8J6I4H3_9FIRM|nr:sigma-E processing peptidase SpoIIGA [Capillibacterium thermochitinicola]MBA2134032.1 sigma-E processing peptidase SpoIIGA [Capillibacterium thermochitinicola]